jgi:hypothetical protein
MIEAMAGASRRRAKNAFNKAGIYPTHEEGKTRRCSGACQRSLPLSPSREGVANTTHGFDQRRSMRVLFHLLAQPCDQIVDRTIKRRPIVPFEKIHNVVARQHAVLPPHKHCQQVELAGGELLSLAAGAFRLRR